MAFLDNSGDILLDAVLTDAGRKRMAEGTFRITKFALADDEIDYSLYDYTDTRGSAYYDLDILSTPILEAFTDNAAGLKSKLVSYTRNDLEFLPVMKLSTLENTYQVNTTTNSFIVSANTDTDATLGTGLLGILKKTQNTTRIQIHQGIDNIQIPHTQELQSDLIETSYIIEMDNRILRLKNTTNNTFATPSYIDDDEIASYIITFGQNSSFFKQITNYNAEDGIGNSVIAGARNPNALELFVSSTDQVAANDYLLDSLGGEFTLDTKNYKYIDLNVRVMGATTGFRIDVPVRVVKIIQ